MEPKLSTQISVNSLSDGVGGFRIDCVRCSPLGGRRRLRGKEDLRLTENGEYLLKELTD
jgi:hypothetical protein